MLLNNLILRNRTKNFKSLKKSLWSPRIMAGRLLSRLQATFWIQLKKCKKWFYFCHLNPKKDIVIFLKFQIYYFASGNFKVNTINVKILTNQDVIFWVKGWNKWVRLKKNNLYYDLKLYNHCKPKPATRGGTQRMSEATIEQLRAGGTGGAGVGRSVNPISTRGADYVHHNTFCPSSFSDRPPAQIERQAGLKSASSSQAPYIDWIKTNVSWVLVGLQFRQH